MQSRGKRLAWRALKLGLALAILAFVTLRIWRDLEGLDLRSIELRPGWLVAASAFYLLGLLPQAWFWRHLLGLFGYPVSLYGGLRANLVSQLGKYVPGKAMALIMRSHLVHPEGVPYGVSVITAFYEVFTGMAAGAMVACVVFAVQPPTLGLGFEGHPALLGIVLIGMCGIPLLPGVFNLIIAKLTARIQAMELYRLPPVRFPTLALGLSASVMGWWLQGLSVWATFQAVIPEPPELTLSRWAQCTAAIAFANVVGFVIFVLPAGFGVREDLLRNLLSDAGPLQYVTVAVILVRLDWIATESLVALIYWIKPTPKSRTEE